MTTTTSRRAIIAGAVALPAIAVAASIPAAQAAVISDHPDAEILALEPKFHEAWNRAEKLGHEAHKIWERCGLKKLSDWKEAEPPAQYRRLYHRLSWREFRALSKDHPLRVWDKKTRRARNRDFRKVMEKRAILEESSGYNAAEERFEAMHDVAMAIDKKMMELSPKTVDGLAAKVRVMEVSYEGGDKEDAWRAIADDILAMGKRVKAIPHAA